MQDQYERKIEYVRISLTDRCNLRCRYCMPEAGVSKMRHEDILTFAEILRIVRGLSALGVKKVRLTGGEPLVRRNITELIHEIRQVPGIEQVVLTTNGVLLSELGQDLIKAGLTGLNISLDTLNPDTFAEITRRPLFARVQAGLEKVMSLGLTNIKFNCVPIYEVNDAEIPALAALARDYPVKVRFIELMPIGCAKGLSGVDSADVLSMLENEYGKAAKEDDGQSSTAEYYGFSGFKGRIGLISPMTHKFCKNCSRIRITADGILKTCLCYEGGVDLRTLIRSGADDSDIIHALGKAIASKPYEHGFGSIASDMEKSNMNTIGG